MAPLEVRSFRRLVLRRDAPSVLQWGFIIYSAATLFDTLDQSNARINLVLDAAVLIVLAVEYVFVRRPSTPDAAMPWLILLAGATMAVGLTAQFHVHPMNPGPSYGNVLLLMVAIGPLTLEYLPTVVMTAIVLGSYAVFRTAWESGEQQGWFTVTLTGVALSFVLLRVRHIGIDALGLATEQVRESALRDPLTGVLNRRGLIELAEPLRGLAHRQGMPAFTLMLDVDGLKAANDEHGHEFGDAVISAVARALTVSVREADLVCRWGGDEFVILGVGAPWPVDEFEHRVERAIVATGIDTERWTPRVTAGSAMHERGDWDVQGLLREADAAMYARRLRLRGGG